MARPVVIRLAATGPLAPSADAADDVAGGGTAELPGSPAVDRWMPSAVTGTRVGISRFDSHQCLDA